MAGAQAIRVAGGRVHAILGAHVVASFALRDTTGTIANLLELFRVHGVASGACCLGEVRHEGEALTGGVFDAAFALASRAHPGELLLDRSFRERMRAAFLFRRAVSVHGVRGDSLDRETPFRSPCVEALGRLSAPSLPRGHAELAQTLVEGMAVDHAFVVVEGSVTSGVDEIVRSAAARAGVRCLVLHPASLPTIPLASLRPALRAIESPVAEVLRRGEIMPYEGVLGLLEREFDCARAPVWVALPPPTDLDRATAFVVTGLRQHPNVRCVVRTPSLDALGVALGSPTLHLKVPALRSIEARQMVGEILRVDLDGDVARRASRMAGDSPVGCLEVVRWLVAAGELVARDGGTDWRTQTRGVSEGLPLEDFIRMRLELLEPAAYALLEVACVVPSGLVHEVAALSGLDPATVERDLEALRAEGWLDGDQVTDFHRRFVVASMLPGRFAALARVALDVAQRNNVERLSWAAWAEVSGSDCSRDENTRLRDLLAEAGFAGSDEPLAAEPTDPAMRPAATDAFDLAALMEASRARDVGRIERWAEAAATRGVDQRTLGRVRAVAEVLRGDAGRADAWLIRARSHDSTASRLVESRMFFAAGRAEDGIRSALAALAIALRESDEKGRVVSLVTLAAAFRSLGREMDAVRLLAAAE